MKLSAARYARAIERAWSSVVERSVVLSPRDWELIRDWHERGVPLQIVEEAIDDAAARIRRRPGTGRGLGYVGAAVEEAWRAIVEGRSRPQPEPPAAAGPAAATDARSGTAAWRRRIAREPADSPLGALLRSLLEAHAAGEDPLALDARLDRELPDRAPPALRRLLAASVDERLGAFRERLDRQAWTAARQRALVSRLRRALDLPRLGAGTGPAPHRDETFGRPGPLRKRGPRQAPEGEA